MEYWRQEFKGSTAKDIVNRIISRFRPEPNEESESEPDLDRDLRAEDSGDDEEPPMPCEHESEADDDTDFGCREEQRNGTNRGVNVGSGHNTDQCVGSGQTDSYRTDQKQQSQGTNVTDAVSSTGSISCLPNSVLYRYGDTLPAYWPEPIADDYQGFFRAFFNGEARDAPGHNWAKELEQCMMVQNSNQGGSDCPCALSVWQAAGYLHARKVVSMPKMKGCLYYWTPGSGKSIMVALLLDVLYTTHYAVYVVSSPQNTKQNDLDCCVKSLLKFSPIFNLGGREPTMEDIKKLRRVLRKRPNGPPILVKNFMTFKQFERYCADKGPDKILERAVVIIDESHLLFDEKKCNKDFIWGTVLETLTRCSDSKVFTFSGTPGNLRREEQNRTALATRTCQSCVNANEPCLPLRGNGRVARSTCKLCSRTGVLCRWNKRPEQVSKKLWGGEGYL